MKTILLAICGVALSIATPIHGRCGDLEKYVRTGANCPAITNGPHLETEQWPTNSVKPWTIRTLTPCGKSSILPGHASPTAATAAPGYAELIAAAGVWNNASTPSASCGGSVQDLSYFALSTTPAINIGPWIGTELSVASPNLVTFFEPPATFASFGASSTIAITLVTYTRGCNSSTPGQITDVDIAFNALGNRYSFVVPGPSNTVFASYPGASFTPPTEAYIDVLGAMVHEFGHFAGLAHSMIDSTAGPTGSRFPSMFPWAQVEPFSETGSFIHTDCAVPNTTLSLLGSATANGGILGGSAATLELDDIAAISRGYPIQPVFTQVTRSIEGTVRDASGNGLNGFSVVAIADGCPDIARAAVLSHDPDGATLGPGYYKLSGLPPGDYWVYVEEVDFNNSSADYFDLEGLPSYLSPLFYTSPNPLPPLPPFCSGFPSCSITEAGVPDPARIYPDFQNGAGEVLLEPLTQDATPVSLLAGNVNPLDFIVEFTPASAPDTHLTLSVRAAGTLPYSMRGLKLDATASAFPAFVGNRADFLVSADPSAHAGDLYLVFKSPSYSLSLQGGIGGTQLMQVAPNFATIVASGNLNGAGLGRFSYTLQSGEVFENLFFQAAIAHTPLPPGGPMIAEELSNLVNVWVWTR